MTNPEQLSHIVNIARQAIEAFNGHPELSYNEAHRLFTAFFKENVSYQGLASDERNKLRDILDEYVSAELKTFTPTKIDYPHHEPKPDAKPKLTNADIDKLVGDTFATTITGDPNQTEYLCYRARQQLSDMMKSAGLSEDEMRSFELYLEGALQDEVNNLWIPPHRDL